MNTARAVETRSRQGLFRPLVLRAMRRASRGSLRMRLPDGTILHLGDAGEPAASLRVSSEAFFRKCALHADVGFGEAYVDGDWDSDDVTAVVAWLIDNFARTSQAPEGVNALGWVNRLFHRFHANTVTGSRRNIRAHYDLGNEFFRAFLDPTMTYSCAYFDTPVRSLEEAQSAKYELLCRKLRLSASDRVLEIGSGWGGFALHAAARHGCRVKTITISREQAEWARRRIREEGLERLVDLEMADYRHVKGRFDKIVSIEMIEAVGHDFLESYFRQCHRLLEPDGLLALQMILVPDGRYEVLRRRVDWIQRHVFPGGQLPSLGAVQEAIRRTGALMLTDYEDLTAHYALTLRAWKDNFAGSLARVKGMGFDDRFVRKWTYYLSYCEAAFRARSIAVAQAVYAFPHNRILAEELR